MVWHTRHNNERWMLVYREETARWRHSNVKLASRRLTSPTNRLLVQQCVQSDNNLKKMKLHITGPLWEESQGLSHHKRPAMRKEFPCHDTAMLILFRVGIYQDGWEWKRPDCTKPRIGYCCIWSTKRRKWLKVENQILQISHPSYIRT